MPFISELEQLRLPALLIIQRNLPLWISQADVQ